jgi:hypothetical protein
VTMTPAAAGIITDAVADLLAEQIDKRAAVAAWREYVLLDVLPALWNPDAPGEFCAAAMSLDPVLTLCRLVATGDDDAAKAYLSQLEEAVREHRALRRLYEEATSA